MDARKSQSFAELLRHARLAAGVTQAELAERAGISTRTVSDLERGIIRAPQPETMRLLAVALQLTPEERRRWADMRQTLARRQADTPRQHPGASSPPAPMPLPQPLTTLVGREQEVAEVTDLLRLPATRLVTLTGTGGVGKTRLALAAAGALDGDFRDGIWFVPLASIRDPQLVGATIATVVGIPVAGHQSAVPALITALRTSQRLLVLDNLEQVVAAAPLLANLLVACPGLRLLTTSRTPLRIRGEREYDVQPFAIPDLHDGTDIEQVRASPAVMLFEQRARDVGAPLQIADEDVRVVARICRQVDGLPLAIELVAAQTRLLPPAALLARLERRLPLLSTGARDAAARHQSLRDTFTWSYELLSPAEQELLRALSVFDGGWTIDAAHAVAAVSSETAEPDTVLGALDALIAHHLVQMQPQPDGEPRYTMLETIRELGQELLAANVAAARISRRHAEYFLATAEEAAPHLAGPEQADWLMLLETEHANLRAAMQWAIAQGRGGDVAAIVLGARLCWALWWFWHVHGHVAECRIQIEAVLDLLDTHQSALEAASSAAARSHLSARVRFLLGIFRIWSTPHEDEYSWALLANSLATFRKLEHDEDTAIALLFMGYGAQRVGRFTEATAYLLEALERYRALEDERNVALIQQGLGMIGLRTGDIEESATWLTASLAALTRLGDARSAAASRATLGAVRLRQGQFDVGTELLRESLRTRLELRDIGGIAWCLEWLAEAAITRQPTAEGALRAARLLGAAAALRTDAGFPIDPVDQPGHARLVAATQAASSDPAFVAAWETGRRMTLEDATAYALEPSAA